VKGGRGIRITIRIKSTISTGNCGDEQTAGLLTHPRSRPATAAGAGNSATARADGWRPGLGGRGKRCGVEIGRAKVSANSSGLVNHRKAASTEQSLQFGRSTVRDDADDAGQHLLCARRQDGEAVISFHVKS
jgi:hypothetical protein